ncbi:MAG: SDR family oxidoreductase [Bacteroidales bacterium]|nr:SDR family oxidoreductase [Bacteroidales bacterium]
MKDKTFQDKVAIITGSSRGIGKAIAVELVRNGAFVVLNGRNQKRLTQAENEINALGGKVLAVCCDVSIPTQAKNLVNKTIETYGKLDILINNAGVSMYGDFSDLKPEVFKTIFETNVFGVVNPTIPALSHIRKSHGSIVFISSLAGTRGLPGHSAYCSSKMALRAITESIRVEEIKSKIHVGLIFVGFTENDPEKKTIAADGSLIAIKNRPNFIKAQTLSSVAKAILKNIRKRKFRTTLTGVGKLNAVMQAIMPGVVEKILIFSMKRMKK